MRILSRNRVALWLALSTMVIVIGAVVAIVILRWLVVQALTPIIVEHDAASATAEQAESVKQIVGKVIGAALPAEASVLRWSATTGPLQGEEEFVVLLRIDESVWRELAASASLLEHQPRGPMWSPSDIEWAMHTSDHPSATEECWSSSDDLLMLECWLVGPPEGRSVAFWFIDEYDTIPALSNWFEGGVSRRAR